MKLFAAPAGAADGAVGFLHATSGGRGFFSADGLRHIFTRRIPVSVATLSGSHARRGAAALLFMCLILEDVAGRRCGVSKRRVIDEKPDGFTRSTVCAGGAADWNAYLII